MSGEELTQTEVIWPEQKVEAIRHHRGGDLSRETLLSGGNVLVAGGFGSAGALATTELYVASTGTWSAVGSMATSRASHTATLITSNTVLVAGGADAAGAVSSSELYDVALGTWSPAPAMVSARQEHTATLLAGGTVLVAGGIGSDWTPLASAELYASGPTASGCLTDSYSDATIPWNSGNADMDNGRSRVHLDSHGGFPQYWQVNADLGYVVEQVAVRVTGNSSAPGFTSHETTGTANDAAQYISRIDVVACSVSSAGNATASLVPGQASIVDTDTGYGGPASGPIISGDGRYIAYASRLANAFSDTLERRDMQTGQIDVVPGNFPNAAAISPDGRFVAYDDPAGPGSIGETYVYDFAAATSTLVSAAADGTAANDWANAVGISADGRYVGFVSRATNLGAPSGNWNLYLRDRTTGTTRLLRDPGATSSDSGSIHDPGRIGAASMSADGRYIVWQRTTLPERLMISDTTLDTVRTMLLGPATAIQSPVISADGRFVAYSAGNGQLLRLNIATGAVEVVSTPLHGQLAGGSYPTISGDGRFVAFLAGGDALPGTPSHGGDCYNSGDVVVHDMQTNATTRVSVANDGLSPTDGCQSDIQISADGNYAAFISTATNVVPGPAPNPGLVHPEIYRRGPLLSSPPPPPLPPPPPPPPPLVKFVALGDSFSSGEGAPPFIVGTDSPPDSTCHRSQVAYPNVLRDQAGVDLPLPEFVACSGAVLDDFYDSYSTNPTHDHSQNLSVPAQQQALNGNTNLITLTFGGNDVGFASILAYCVAATSCQDDLTALAAGRGTDAADVNIRALYPRLVALYHAIRADATNSTVVVVGYPQIVGEGNIFCNEIDAGEASVIRGRFHEMNQVISLAARAAGVHYVDIEDVLRGHEVCSAGPWVNGLVTKNLVFSFHPNDQGQAAIAKRVALAQFIRHVPDHADNPAPDPTVTSPDDPGAPIEFPSVVTSGALGAAQTLCGTCRLVTSVGNFLGGAVINLFVHSDVVALGTATADADGNVLINVALPNLAPGFHVLAIEGPGSDGNLRVATVGFVVNSSNLGTVALARSGISVAQLVSIGLGLTLSGGLLVSESELAQRRRRRGRHFSGRRLSPRNLLIRRSVPLRHMQIRRRHGSRLRS